MKFKDYIIEDKKLKNTMIGFGIDMNKLKKIYSYLESWLIRYKVDYIIQDMPHISIAQIPKIYSKDELVREINKISNNISFNPKRMAIFRGKRVKKDFIVLEYKPNKALIDNFKEISSRFETFKFEEIRPHVSLFIVKQGSISDDLFNDIKYNMPKLPKLEPIGVELWGGKFQKEYIKR